MTHRINQDFSIKNGGHMNFVMVVQLLNIIILLEKQTKY
jgi:hypothetical protein